MNYFKKITGMVGVLGAILISPATIMAATLSFDPASGVINKGCEISIKVNLDTQGAQTDGSDVIVLYTPAQLSITTAQIINGTTYPEYTGVSVDPQGGKLSISGISSVSGSAPGSGTFATLKFNVASTLAENTKVNLNFDFDPNDKTKTVDSNVIEKGTVADILSGVTNGSYTVGSGTCTGGVAPAGTSGGSSLTGGAGQGQALPGSGLTASQSAQYQVYRPNLNDLTGNGTGAGLLDNTIVLTAVGAVLVVLGIAGLVML